jgi:hypothetical protein
MVKNFGYLLSPLIFRLIPSMQKDDKMTRCDAVRGSISTKLYGTNPIHISLQGVAPTAMEYGRLRWLSEPFPNWRFLIAAMSPPFSSVVGKI